MFIERKKQMKATLLATAAALLPFGAMAQDRVEATAGADLVSGYIWRGQDLGNVSIQPSASVWRPGPMAWGAFSYTWHS